MGIKIIKKPMSEQVIPDCAVWEITLLCNFKCMHCGSSAGRNRENELSLEEIKRVAGDLKRIDFKRVSLIGGETFLRPDWYEIACLIKDLNIGITYVTNGSLFPENNNLVSKVIKTKPQVIGFSLDGGIPETHDRIRGYKSSFDKVFKSIEIFNKSGIDISIITTLNKLNVHELPLIRDLILGKGIGWQIQIASKNGCRFNGEHFIDKEDYFCIAKFVHDSAEKYPVNELPIAGADDIGYFSKKFPMCSINYRSWKGCKAGKTNLGIQSNGNIKGCNSLPDQYIEGNIRDRSVYDIWNDPKSFWYSRHFDNNYLKGCCSTCEHGAECKGGCIDIAHSITGHAFENTYCLHINE